MSMIEIWIACDSCELVERQTNVTCARDAGWTDIADHGGIPRTFVGKCPRCSRKSPAPVRSCPSQLGRFEHTLKGCV